MFSDSICPTFRKIFVASVFGFCVFLIPNGVQSATNNSATLQWAANQETDLAGYRVYHGTTTGNYGSPQSAGKTTSYQYPNLESNKTHYFSVTAFDTAGNESPPSPEVYKTIIGADRLLSVSVNGRGAVTSSPAGLSCSSASCSGTFTQGSNVTLTAVPSNGAIFVGWNGAGCSGNGSCVIPLPQAHTVTAMFTTALTALQVSTPLVLDGRTDESVWSQANSVTFSNAQHSNNAVTVATLWDATNLYFAFTVTDDQLEVDAVSSSLYRDDGVEFYLDTNHDESLSRDGNDYHSIVNYLDEATLADINTATATSSTGFVMELSIPWTTLNTTAVAGKVLGLLLGNNDRDNGSSAQFDWLGLIDSAGSYGNPSLWGDLVLSGQMVVVNKPELAEAEALQEQQRVAEAAKLAEQQRVAEAARLAEEQRVAEAARLAEEQRVAEAAKLAEQQRVAEAARLAEEQRVAEAARLAEQQRVAEAARLAEQQRVAEAARLAEQQRVAEAARLAEQQRVAEAARLAEEQRVAEAFDSENSEPSLSKPNLPILVNFQPTASQVPTNFKKDDGSVFTSTRGYGWNKLLNGMEKNSTADQTLDTFVSASNQSPSTWNFRIPNGIYYVTMVLGDPKDAQGPHWVSVEGFQLAKQVNTAGGEYLAIVDYSVEVKDSTLSLTLGNSGQGQTTLNYLAINEKPNLSNATQILTQSFGTTLVTSVLNSGEATKINPVVLVQKDQEEKDLQEKSIAQKIKEEEAAALAQVKVNEQKEQEVAKLNQIIKQKEAAARTQDRMEKEKEKEQEVAKLNEIKDKMLSIRKSGGTVSLRNLFGGP